MEFGVFLREYREGIRAATGKVFSRKELVEKVFSGKGFDEVGLRQIAKRLEKWETDGVIPSSDNERVILKAFFKIKDLENPTDTELAKAITAQGEDDDVPAEPVKLSKPKQVYSIGKEPFTGVAREDYGSAYKAWKGVPMYNAPVTASFIETYRDDNFYQPTYYLHDPRFKGCKFGAIITGDSMHSEIRHGDHVICQEITDWRFVVYGDIYYIVSSNGLETCKYLNADPDNPDNFLLVPRNEAISPSPIPKDMILKMYKVRGVVRGY
jgi:hypothetical protein